MSLHEGVPVFRRRRSEQSDIDPVEVEVVGSNDPAPESSSRASDRSRGPYDVSEIPDDGVPRLDLGALLVPGVDGMELRLDVDEVSQQIIAVSVVHGDSALQLMAFAAPRTEGIWDDVREQIRASIAATGLVEQVEGDFGPELRATVAQNGPGGQSVMAPVRFIGVDGPRWFLRGVLSGVAARDPQAAAGLEAILRATVVVRGNDPMAPGDALTLRIPEGIPEPGTAGDDSVGEDAGVEEAADEQERPRLTMPERGPEITEVR